MNISRQVTSVKVRDMIETSLLIALVFVATAFINIRLPITANGGIVHLGTAVLFISSIVFGRKKGAIAGAVGMGLFDITSGWIIWAPATFIIRGFMGYVLGTVAYSRGKKGNSLLYNILGIIISGIIMISGYYITEIIFYGNILAPLTSIPGNFIQIAVGGIVAVPLSKVLKKYFR